MVLPCVVGPSMLVLGMTLDKIKAGWWGSVVGLLFCSWFSVICSNQTGVLAHLVVSGLFLDPLSCVLITLVFMVAGLSLLAGTEVYNEEESMEQFLLCIVSAGVMMVLAFSSSSMLWFYFYFEGSLVPLLVMMIGWGYQPERVQASSSLLLYTLFGSVPFLGLLSWGVASTCSGFMWGGWNGALREVWWIFALLPFLVKLPIYGLHGWLPKAHVEAPTSGSMMLAGLTLKLGGYGMMRSIEYFCMSAGVVLWGILAMSLWGGLLTGLVCLRQVDMKSLIAYSSISHMSLVLGGIISMSPLGWGGSFAMMVGHAFSSAGMFFWSGVIFNKSESRSVYVNKGLLSLFPMMSGMFVVVLAGNMAGPFSLNLMGEGALVMALLSLCLSSVLVLVFMCVLGGAYSLFLYGVTNHGLVSSSLHRVGGVSVVEGLVMLAHCGLIFLGVFLGDFFFCWG